MGNALRFRSGHLRAFAAMAALAMAAPLPAGAQTAPEGFEAVYRAYQQELAGRHYAAAIPHAEQALEMARTSSAFDPAFVRALRASLGSMYAALGRWADADSVFDDYRASRPPQLAVSDEFLRVLLQAGTAKRELGRAIEAESLFRRALLHLDRRDGSRRPVRADTLNQLTLVLLALKQADRALETGSEAFELYQSLYGPSDRRTLEAGLTLARTEAILLKNGRARGHLESLSARLEANSGLRDWQKAELHGRIAALYESMNDLETAGQHRVLADAFLRGLGDVELELKSAPPPEYPRDAEQDGISGFVVVEFTIEKDGDVEDIRVLRASPPGVFDRAVLRAVKKWRFEPPRQNGERVRFPGLRKTIEFRAPE